MTYKLRDVVTAIGGELIKGDPVVEIKGISTDTRTIAPGDLFFALIGENSDGHEYVQTAVEKGAAAVVVSKQVDTDSAIILVPDTLIALGDLAALHRRQFRVRVVGITGSVGKTSTKEMVAAVLSSRYNVLKNAGNFNNEIGVPLTIFQLKPEHEILVQEMAMRLPGEIAELAEIAKPDIGVITNIGVSHIERLGTRDNIAAAKAELLESLSIDGIAVLNADDPYFDFLSGKTAAGVVSYGISSGNVQASNIRIDSMGRPSFKVKVGKSEFDVILPLPGEHNVPNALAAIAVGLCFGIPVKESTAALASMVAADKRANVFDAAGGYKVFDDTYNASPASMIAALRTLAAMEGKRKIAVLGDMKELGDYAVQGHTEVGQEAVKSGLAMLVTVGELSRQIATSAREAGFAGEVRECETSDEAAEMLKSEVKPGDVVLAKGSRAMKMENIVEVLK
mgnify:CR=1 FL=1